jgi:hypothetical protein
MSLTVKLEQRFYGMMMTTWLVAQCEWQGSPDVQRAYDKRQHDYLYTLKHSAWTALLGFIGTSATGLTLSKPALKHFASTIQWLAQHGSPTAPPEPKITNAPEVLPNQMPLLSEDEPYK